MRPLLAFMPRKFSFDFLAQRYIAFALTAVIIIGSIVAVATRGLNFGVDFAGGIMIEIQTEQPANMAELRRTLNNLELGGVVLQQFGETGRDVMVRIPRQPGEERAQMAALDQVKQALGAGVDYRRVEIVGPKVGDELVRDGALAVLFSVLAIAAYVWFRFEWQFGIGALAATFHDVIATLGFFALTQLEFNLTSVAAILTIAGYSINDTVVIYDRVRENLRKYKVMTLFDLLNLSANETLARTILTGGTTLLALTALGVFGGSVLYGFAMAVIFGVVIGTFSSIYVAIPILIFFNLRTGKDEEEEGAGQESGEQAAP